MTAAARATVWGGVTAAPRAAVVVAINRGVVVVTSPRHDVAGGERGLLPGDGEWRVVACTGQMEAIPRVHLHSAFGN